MCEAHLLIMISGMSSRPWENLFFKIFMMSSTSLFVTGVKNREFFICVELETDTLFGHEWVFLAKFVK